MGKLAIGFNKPSVIRADGDDAFIRSHDFFRLST
jgi:hypothetical protein